METLNNIKDISVLNKKQMKNVKGGAMLVGEAAGATGATGDISKTEACNGKDLCASCKWVYEGKTYYGKCSQNVFTKARYCSDLNCHYVDEVAGINIADFNNVTSTSVANIGTSANIAPASFAIG